MNPTFESGPSSTHQRAPHQHHQRQHSSHKSPHSTATDQSENSPAAGRQRARTESLSRHQHTPSGWLGPYHEQPSPNPGGRVLSRGPKLPGGHPSAALDRGAGIGAGSGSGSSIGGSDRILETHRALGGWRTDGGSSSSSIHAVGGSDGVGVERREIELKNNDTTGFGGPSTEPSTSLQSLVESIGNDHVFRLTEMTKKRVEHNNPAQKRQRVVSLPAAEAVNFQPSEKTLQFSSSCKAYLESRYTQLFQSINAGRPINRLRKLHEVLPQIKSMSIPKPAHDSKISLDLGHSRSRRWKGDKGDKYRFVDKIEESSCIWDVDHMEAKAAAEAAAEAAALAKQSAVASSRHGSHHNLESTAWSSPHDSGQRQLTSASTESLGTGKTLPGDTNALPVAISHQPQSDSTLAVVDVHDFSMGLSPSTFSSMTNPHHVNDSSTNSSSLLDRTPPKQQKEVLGESKLRFAESYLTSLHGNSTHTIKSMDSGNNNSSGLESAGIMETPSSKRNSFLGIFNMRGKKVGQDGDQLNTHHELPQLSSPGGPRLRSNSMTHERRSFDSQRSLHSRPSHALFNPNRRRQSVMEMATLSHFNSLPINMSGAGTNTQAPYKMPLEEGVRTGEYSETGNAGLTDDDFG
ncbi:hypothetical protein BGZ65_008036, partial [Modicella reniformis]